jgi:8-oxo-dGTP pyrophosphatase MutT (NUDIX family)
MTKTRTIQMYSIAFVFDPEQKLVCLIRKARPDWQAGHLNAPGGHIEPGETPHDAIVREIEEETGFIIPEFNHVAVLESRDYKLHVFTKTLETYKIPENQDENEPVHWYAVHPLSSACIFNLNWLIPLCLDKNIANLIHILVLK